jgi:hypothetical protein
MVSMDWSVLHHRPTAVETEVCGLGKSPAATATAGRAVVVLLEPATGIRKTRLMVVSHYIHIALAPDRPTRGLWRHTVVVLAVQSWASLRCGSGPHVRPRRLARTPSVPPFLPGSFFLRIELECWLASFRPVATTVGSNRSAAKTPQLVSGRASCCCSPPSILVEPPCKSGDER